MQDTWTLSLEHIIVVAQGLEHQRHIWDCPCFCSLEAFDRSEFWFESVADRVLCRPFPSAVLLT